MVYKVVFIRHGESEWNKENLFSGWTDVDLSDTGRAEAVEAAKALKDNGFTNFDVAYTSVLKRAIHTCWTILKELDISHTPVINTWRLNERHYGALQGLNKVQTTEKHGEAKVKEWRRSYDIPPPPLELSDPKHPVNDKRYKFVPQGCLPATECLKDVVERVLPYWFDNIAADIMAGKQVIVAAHGNSLRGIVKFLDNVDEKEIAELNIPTGVPLVYELDDKLKPIKHYYLMDEEEVKKKIAAVAAQATAGKK